MRFLLQLIISALAAIVSTFIIPGIELDSPLTAVILAAVLAFLNTIVKPVMIIFTIPVTIFTLGLFMLVINALIILLADYMVDGFEVAGFWNALGFSIVLSLVTGIFESLNRRYSGKNDDEVN